MIEPDGPTMSAEEFMSATKASGRRRFHYPEQPLQAQRPRRYQLFYKPYDVLSEFDDAEGRVTLRSFIPVAEMNVAGRLDQDSEGLLLLTDDGELAHRLTHPDYHLPKTYLVQVEGVPPKSALDALRAGVLVKGITTAAAEVDLLENAPDLPPRSTPVHENPAVPTAWLRMVIREGKKRQIRHMTAAVGHPTLRLVRVAIGPLTLRGLAPGEWRDVEPAELGKLHRSLRAGQKASQRGQKAQRHR
jgi:23S rRNA pseudouridine2457 synthase